MKLYDRASAVVAELIANAYDADAENVTVTLPLAKQLARKRSGGTHEDRGFTINVRDVGHGMTPQEAQHYFVILDGAEHLEPRVAQPLAGTSRSGEQIDGGEFPSHDCRLELAAVHPVKLLTTPHGRR